MIHPDIVLIIDPGYGIDVIGMLMLCFLEVMQNVVAAAHLARVAGTDVKDVLALLLLEILCIESGDSVPALWNRTDRTPDRRAGGYRGRRFAAQSA